MSHASTTLRTEREFAFSHKDFAFISALALEKTGIVLTDAKRDMVYGRLARRLRALGMDSFQPYCELLQSPEGADEMPHLVNAITTNLTGFFREAHHFEHLREQVVQWEKSGRKQLRLWSAACSSGMEPYSMAMSLKAAVPNIHQWDARILASDIDSNMLHVGKTGEYSLSDIENVPSDCKSMVNTLPGNKVMMRDELKQLIAFRQLNLLENWPMKGQFDAVFCRNVVIYFNKPTKQLLFERMAQIIKPNGWLYIGHSENLHGISNRFELVGRTIYRRLP